MKKVLSILCVFGLLFSMLTLISAETSVNGFIPFEKGGYLEGTYYPITSEAVGLNSVKFTGKGGFSWPDADNNPEADSMGGMYNTPIYMDGLKFSFSIGTDLAALDRWYAVSFASAPRLFDLWNGDKTADCGFIRLNFDNGVMGISSNKHTGANTWQDLGGTSIPYTLGDTVNFELKKVTGGYELYANSNVITFGASTVIAWEDVLPTGSAYFMTGAHIGNPGGAFSGTFNYTVGLYPKENETKINGFIPFSKGGFVNGEYFPINATAFSDNAITLTGKGGPSWPDTANNPIPSAMGAIYSTALNMDGLKFSYALNQDMVDFTSAHWYVLSFADSARLFNGWDGADPVSNGFLMMVYDGTYLVIMPHSSTPEAPWTYYGTGYIEYELGQVVNFEFKKVTGGYELFINGTRKTFKDPTDAAYTTIPWTTAIPNEQVYLISAAYVGNPDQPPYAGEYSYTLGVGEYVPETTPTVEPTVTTAAESETDENPQTNDRFSYLIMLAIAATGGLVLIAARRTKRIQ